MDLPPADTRLTTPFTKTSIGNRIYKLVNYSNSVVAQRQAPFQNATFGPDVEFAPRFFVDIPSPDVLPPGGAGFPAPKERKLLVWGPVVIWRSPSTGHAPNLVSKA